MNPPSPQALCPRTVEDIHAVQLDIIYLLIQAGADPTAVDVQGHSASYRACHELEDVFLEGAILIGIGGGGGGEEILWSTRLCDCIFQHVEYK